MFGKLKTRMREWWMRRLTDMLRPHVGRMMAQLAEEWEVDDCPDADIPDAEECAACEYHGHCPYEPGVVMEAPPGFVLVRSGPPPSPSDLN